MSTPRRLLFGAGLAGALLLAAQCGSTGTESAPAVAGATSLPSWSVIYGVLQHPRCMNCHPLGDAPLQGDASAPHAQNVRCRRFTGPESMKRSMATARLHPA